MLPWCYLIRSNDCIMQKTVCAWVTSKYNSNSAYLLKKFLYLYFLCPDIICLDLIGYIKSARKNQNLHIWQEKKKQIGIF